MDSLSLKKILLVEDDCHLQYIAKIALENVGGFTVKTCSSGNEAISEGRNFLPDLILLDVMMPGMDGPSTLKMFGHFPETAKTPVIFMSAKVQKHEVEYYRSIGAVDVISKPFDPMTLSNCIREIWEKFQKS